MLRKRTRSVQKDQQMGLLPVTDSGSQLHVLSDSSLNNHKASALFSVPRLFIGLYPKGLSDADLVRSPTSPLDFKIVSNIGKAYKSSNSGYNEHQKTWDCSKVGLGIVDTLDADLKGFGKGIRSSDSKNIIFGPQVRIKRSTFHSNAESFGGPMSLPRDFAIRNHYTNTNSKPSLSEGNSDAIFEIGDAPPELEPKHFGKLWSCSLDSCTLLSAIPQFADLSFEVGSEYLVLDNLTTQGSSAPQLVGEGQNLFYSLRANKTPTPTYDSSSLCANDIELSEDYTCIISRGPNPKMTHIYGERILGFDTTDNVNLCPNREKETVASQIAVNLATQSQLSGHGFLSFCDHCKKKLDNGKDIYIYRGEKAFCSPSCRAEEIMIDEELEKSTEESKELDNNGHEYCAGGIFDAA